MGNEEGDGLDIWNSVLSLNYSVNLKLYLKIVNDFLKLSLHCLPCLVLLEKSAVILFSFFVCIAPFFLLF